MENRRPEMTETARRAIGALSRIGRALAVPPLGAATASALVSAVLLIWTFTGGPDRTGHPVAYLSYLLSAYALVVWCIRIARAKPVRRVGDALRANRHAARLLDDAHHRLGVSTALSFGVDLIWTLGNAYAAATQRSMWFCTLAVYYAALCLMRLPLSVAILRSSGTSSDARESGIGYRLRRICGITLAACSIVFTGFVVLAIHREGAFSYRGSLLFAVALYAFYSLISCIVRMVRTRKDPRPLVSAANAVNLAVSSVSMFALEVAMLDRFNTAGQEGFRFLMIAGTGAVVCLLTSGLGIWMARRAHEAAERNR